jgi:hypothetical protein
MWDESVGNGERKPTEAPLALKASPPLPCGWKAECGAKTRGGAPCRRPPLEGRTRCRLHGGATPAGVASPHFRHGRRSRYLKDLPRDLGRAYRAALDDDELLSLRHELALTVAFIRGRLAELPAAAPAWGKAVEALNDYKLAKGDAEKAAALAALEQVVRAGAAAVSRERDVREEVRELMQEKGRLAAAEWRRLIDLRAVVPVEQAVLFAQNIVALILEIYGRDERLALLQQRLAALAPTARD